MITGELRSKIDKVWEAFWTGGLANPITVIEQMTYLLFIRRLDELQTQKEQKATFLKKPIDKPLFTQKQYELRWSRFKNTDPDVMFRLFTKENGVFDFLKSAAQNGSVLTKFITGPGLAIGRKIKSDFDALLPPLELPDFSKWVSSG